MWMWQHEKGFHPFVLSSDCWNVSAAFVCCFRLPITTCCHWVNVTPALIEPLVEHFFLYLFFSQFTTKVGMREALHDPLVNRHSDTLSSVNPIYRLYWLLETGQAEARLLLLVLFLARPTVSVRRKHPDRCGWTTSSWCNSEDERSKERKKRKWTKQRSAQVPPFQCVHMCTGAYIRGVHSLRQSINTHNASGEAGRRVRVIQRITPLLSLHLSPFVSPAFLLLSSSSSSSTTVTVAVVTLCLFSEKNPEEKLRPPVGMKRLSKKTGEA